MLVLKHGIASSKTELIRCSPLSYENGPFLVRWGMNARRIKSFCHLTLKSNRDDYIVHSICTIYARWGLGAKLKGTLFKLPKNTFYSTVDCVFGSQTVICPSNVRWISEKFIWKYILVQTNRSQPLILRQRQRILNIYMCLEHSVDVDCLS